ncbi:MAG: hypothetical protein IPG49_05450 [Proteobacteria bacterium]|nr:hypothetical protein [Pseudomonadota bacterium]
MRRSITSANGVVPIAGFGDPANGKRSRASRVSCSSRYRFVASSRRQLQGGYITRRAASVATVGHH